MSSTMVAPPPASGGNPPRAFPFRLTRAARLLFWPWGVGIRPTGVDLDETALRVRFGWFETTIALADIQRYEIQGPYTWLRAITVRHTVFTHDISFCSDERGAVVLFLTTPRRIAFVRGCDVVYVGIEDLGGLAEALTERGISGTDKRSGSSASA
jgi:hypothetical protein